MRTPQGLAGRAMLAAGVVLLAWASAAPRTAAAVRAGSSRAELLAEWGQPQGTFTMGDRTVLLFPDGRRVELRDERVLSISEAEASAVAPAPGPVPATGAPAPVRLPAVPAVAQAGQEAPDPMFVRAWDHGRETPEIEVTWASGPWAELFHRAQDRSHAAESPANQLLARRRPAELQAALAAGADPNVRDDRLERSALHELASRPFTGMGADNLGLMAVLLENGADVEARDAFGQTPLHLAAGSALRNLDCLLAAGASINAQDNAGQTPLHLAVLSRRGGCREALLKAGADPQIPDAAGVRVADIEREQARWVRRLEPKGGLSDLCSGSGLFLACIPFQPELLISADGAHWRSVPYPHRNGLASLSSLGKGFLGWSAHGTLAVSPDGVTWTEVPIPGRTALLSLAAVGPGRAVCMGMAATVLHSIDGRVWESLAQGVCAYVVGVTWFRDSFWAAGRDGVVLRSADGLEWEKARLHLRRLQLKRFCAAGDALFAVGYRGLMLRSADGVRWAQVPLPVETAINDVAWGAGHYVAAGDAGVVLLSEDGLRWRLRKPAESGDFGRVVHDRRTFVLAARDALWSWHLD